MVCASRQLESASRIVFTILWVISVTNLAQRYVAQKDVLWTDHVSTALLPISKLLLAPPVSVATGALIAVSYVKKVANLTASLSLAKRVTENATADALQASTAIGATKAATKVARTTSATSPTVHAAA